MFFFTSSFKMKAKHFLMLLGTTFAVTAGSVLYGLLEAPYGDLTRIGALPESDFGWRQPQTPVAAEWLIDSPTSEADVIVIGDSFSISGLWQSRLVKSGLRVRTFHWNVLNNGETPLRLWLAQQGIKNTTPVVIQTVEREAHERIKSLLDAEENFAPATGADALPANQAIRRYSTPRHLPPSGPELEQDIRMSSGLRMLYNQMRIASGKPFSSKYVGQSIATKVSALPTGCDWFSNKRCDRLLSLSNDETHPKWQGEDTARLLKLSQTYQHLHLVWAITPNKSSIYLGADPQTAAWADLAKNKLGPDLFQLFNAEKKKTKDVYYPNDSHLSNNGYLLMGNALVDWLKR